MKICSVDIIVNNESVVFRRLFLLLILTQINKVFQANLFGHVLLKRIILNARSENIMNMDSDVTMLYYLFSLRIFINIFSVKIY